MDPPWRQQVARFCHQYFQLEPNLDYPQAEYLCMDEVQHDIYKRIFHDDVSHVGPPYRYRVRVLKELVYRTESAIDDWDKHAVSDDLMSTLSALLAGPIPIEAISTQKKCHVTYHLSLLESKAQAKANSQGLSIALFENRNLIAAGGTTGHRTWEAALQLGQYLCQNPNIVAGRRILELGAGTGYPSILCAKHLQAEHAIASDGSDDVINNLPDNLFLNNLQDSSKITPMDLKWGHALVGTEDEKWNGGRPVDIILGADITYDRRVLPALMATLCDLFSMYPKAAAYISATARNAETFQAFLDVCRQRDLAVRDLEVEVPPRWKQNGPFYDDRLAIRLYRVSKP